MRLALVFGGRSSEHEVSVVSARSVRQSLDPDRYQVLPMAIDRSGRWADADTAAAVLERSGDRPDEVMSFTGERAIDPRLLEGRIDVVFPVLHGPFGEDGAIQGLFEMLDLPYVGCDVEASAVCMDKATTKRLLAQAGVLIAPWVEVDAHTWHARQEAIARSCLELKLPLFVKPSRLGSSLGISKISDPSALPAAVEAAFDHDSRLVIEKGIDGREIEVAVLGNEDPRASLPGEVVPGHEFYDYADKYLDEACELRAPAPLDEDRTERARELALEVYRSLGCAGMARVDLFLERSSDRFFVNEVNTIPGFTSISMFPRLWALTGVPFPRLLDRLVDLALARRNRQRPLTSDDHLK